MSPYLFPLASPSLPPSLSHPSRWSQSTKLMRALFFWGEAAWYSESVPLKVDCICSLNIPFTFRTYILAHTINFTLKK